MHGIHGQLLRDSHAVWAIFEQFMSKKHPKNGKIRAENNGLTSEKC